MRNILLLSLCIAAALANAAEVDTNIVAAPVVAVPQLVIPAAGSAPGANGTFFRSDITLINFRDVAQRVELRWVPQAGAATIAPVFISVPARSAIRSEDFVRDVLRHEGVGAIVATGTEEQGVPELAARLSASSRIWTPQPGTAGTTSQSMPALPGVPSAGDVAAIFGLRRDERYRVNVAIVNLDGQRTQTFEVQNATAVLSLPPEVYMVTLPPLSMRQIAMNAPAAPPLFQITIVNTTAAAARSRLWFAYGSSIDNVTGDAWSELATSGSQLQ